MLAFANGVTALAIEKVHFRDSDNKERWVSGEILVEAQNGGMMIQADDSRIWFICLLSLSNDQCHFSLIVYFERIDSCDSV